MKKVFVAVLCLMMISSFVGCNNNINNNNTNEEISSIESIQNTESSFSNDKPYGIDGLVDIDDSPAGKTYLGVSGEGFTGYFAQDGYYTAQSIETSEWKPKDKWEKLANGQIKKTYSKNASVVYYFFMYEGYLVNVEKESCWNKLSGNYDMGYEHYSKIAENREIILKSDGTYINTYGFGEPKGVYKILSERIIKIEAYEDNGNYREEYYLVDNDNYLHRAYPEVK